MAEDLETFVENLVEDISFIVSNIHILAPGHSAATYNGLNSAWAEISEEDYESRLTESLEQQDEELNEHGLAAGSDQLSFKLSAVGEIRDGFTRVRDMLLEEDFEGYSPAVISTIASPIAGEYLSAADNLLGSIIDAIPGGGAEPIREIKDFILDLIPWK